MKDLITQCIKLCEHLNQNFPIESFDKFQKIAHRKINKEEFASDYTQAICIFTCFVVLYPEIKIPLSIYDLFKDKVIFDNEVLTIIKEIERISDTESAQLKKKDFVYFYENFLKEYDKSQKNSFGVYYTPEPITHFIMKGVNDILKRDFGCRLGLASHNIELIDFATGSGAFLKKAFEISLEEDNKKESYHNFYGYEYSIAPFIAAHLCLQKGIQEKGLELEESKFFKILLKNTLYEYCAR